MRQGGPTCDFTVPFWGALELTRPRSRKDTTLNSWRTQDLPRFVGIRAAWLLGWLPLCAALAWGQTNPEPPPRVAPTPPTPAEAKPPALPRANGDSGGDFRPSKPDVYYLRDKDGKLVPVPDFTYEDFRRLYDLDQKLADAAAPPRYILSQLQVTGKVENELAKLTVQVRLATKGEGWIQVPLRLAGAVLRGEPKVAGGGEVMVEYHRERDGYIVWLQGGGDKPRQFTLDVVVPLRRVGASRRLALSCPNASTSELRVIVPGQRVTATVSEGAGLLGVQPKGGETSEIQVAGIGGEFQLNWVDSPTEAAGTPTTLEASASIAVRIEGPRRITSDARLRMRSYGAPLTAFRVKLPAGLDWFPLNEPGYRVALVETLRAEGKPPISLVEVTLDNKQAYVADVRLRAVTPAREAAADERQESLGFEVLGAVRQFGQADFVIDGDWAVTWPDRDNVQQVEVPDALRQQRVAARFEYFRQPCSLSVLVQPRKTRVHCEPEYSLQVGPQNLRLTASLRYRVRGPQAERLVIELAGWKLERVQPETLVDNDMVREAANSVLTLPLTTDPAAPQEFELKLEASRPTMPQGDLLTIPIPRPQVDTMAPARLFVAPAENVSLSPRMRDMPGGIAQVTLPGPASSPATPGGLGGLGNVMAYEIRADVDQPRFVADYKLRARQVVVALDHRVRVEAKRLIVEQRWACRVAYEPLARLRLAVPSSVADSGFQFFIERATGDLDLLTPRDEEELSDEEPKGLTAKTRTQVVDLSPEQLGEFVLISRYTVPWEAQLDGGGTTAVQVPLILPFEEPSTRLATNTLRVAREPDWQVEAPDASWVPDLRAGERTAETLGAAPELVRAAAGWTDTATLEVTPVRSYEKLGTIVRRAWVQSWMGPDYRQDRVTLRVQSSEGRTTLTLPGDIDREDLLVAVDGRRVDPAVSADGVLRIEWPAEAGDESREKTIELSYLAPRVAGAAGKIEVRLPQVSGARGEQRWLWQLVLPPQEHLVVAPSGWVPQRRWIWRAGFLDRLMGGTQGDLERAFRASPQIEPPPEANQYLFSSFAPGAMVEARVMDRATLVLIASGAVLACGLASLYMPRLRHPAMLWLIAVAGVSTSMIMPALAALVLQAGALGVALALCGVALHRLVRRRQGQRSVVRGVSGSVAEKPISDFRKGRADSGMQATTATLPPSLPPTVGAMLFVVAGWMSEASAQVAAPASPTVPLAPGTAALPGAALGSGGAVGVRGERQPLFRRVLVREEQVPELSRGHLPIARDEFERLLADSQRFSPQGAPTTRIEQADYVSRWESPGQMVGETHLRIRRQGSLTTLLSLDPCDLPVTEARWTTAGESGAGREALVGATTAGAACVVVERDGDLTWRFSLRADSESQGGTRFRVKLPKCARQRWWMELPDPLAPQVTDAVVVGPGAENLVADVPSAVRSTPGRAWWCVELGGKGEFEWTARSPPAGEPWKAPFVWRDDTQYDIGIQGTEVRATFRVDVTSESLSSLSFELPDSLQIASVRWGDAALSWTTRVGEEPGRAVIQVDLPELQGSDRVVAITGLSPTPLGEIWSLPRILCKGGLWQESTVSTTVAEPLQMKSLKILEGRQTRIGSLASPVAGVTWSAQFHDLSGRAELLVASPLARIRVLMGTSVAVESASLTGRVEAVLTAAEGRTFQVAADVPQAWLVDGVEVTPESLVEDFSWGAAPRRDQRRLSIRLRSPLTRDRELRLAIRAHRPRPAGGAALTSAMLRLAEFVEDERQTFDRRSLVAARAEPGSPLRFRGEGDMTWLTADQLAGPEVELLDEEADYLYVDDRESSGLRGVSRRAPDAYSADVDVVVRAVRDRLHERYRVTCEPRGAPVTRLVALFSQSRTAPLEWRVEGDDEALFQARRLTDQEVAAVTRAAAEGWEVVLRSPRSRPFTLRAERVSPWTEKLPVSLISLPESETQRGVVRFESAEEPLVVGQTGLEGVPAQSGVASDGEGWAAAYRYDPAKSPAITVARGVVAEDVHAAWAWSQELTTYHLRGGERFHELVYWIENRGARQTLLDLPADATRVSITVNGLPRSARVERRGEVVVAAIPLPETERRVMARITFQTGGETLGVTARLRSMEPRLAIPTLSKTWIARFPAAFRLWNQKPWTGESGPDLWEQIAESTARRLVALITTGSDFSGRYRPDEMWGDSGQDKSATTGESADDRESVVSPVDSQEVWGKWVWRGGETSPPAVMIVDGEWMDGAGWLLLLIVAGIVAWPKGGQLRVLPCLAAFLVAALPWVSTGWDPLPSGLFLGLGLGAAIAALRRVPGNSPGRPLQEGSTRRMLGVAPAAGCLLALLSCSLAAWTQVKAQEGSLASREDYQVLYPVDEEGRPAGDYVHVPQPLYQELRRRARGDSGSLAGPLWLSANYRLVVRELPELVDAMGEQAERTAGWEVASLTADWEIETFAPNQRVMLPGLAGTVLISQRVMMDGRLLESPWEPTAQGWTLSLENPGRYQLQVAWRPTLRRRATPVAGAVTSDATTANSPLGERWGIAQAVPRIPQSRVSIQFPDGFRWLDLPAARGGITRDVAAQEWRADLGPVEQLVVEGVGGRADSNPTMPVDVEQLVWFHIRPGSVTLETQWTFSTLAGKLPRLARLSVDSRLRLLPLAAGQPVTGVTQPEPGSPWIQWEWDESVVETGKVRFSFLLAGASGIGQWQLPRMQPWNARWARRLLALSAVPTLETQRTGLASLQPIPVAEFLEAWGEAESTPSQTLQLASGDSSWGFATRVREPRVHAAMSAEVSVDVARVTLLWGADLEVSEGVVWQHTVIVPSNLQVTDVALVDRAREESRVLLWSRPSPDRIQVLLNAPLDGPHRLTISGEMPVPRNAAWRLPQLTLEGATAISQRQLVYRRSTASVKFEQPLPPGLVLAEASEYRTGWGRRIAAWDPPSPAVMDEVAPMLRTAANVVRARPRIGMAIAQSSDGLVGEVTGHVVLESGELDSLKLETPAEWPSELTIEPPTPYLWRQWPGQDRKVLVLRPDNPWKTSFVFRISGIDAEMSGERWGIPDVKAIDFDDAEYYVWLPRRGGARSLTWETSGLQATRWPQGLPFGRGALDISAVTGPDVEEGTTYRTVGARFRAVPRDSEEFEGAPRVRLADHRLLLDDRSTGWGVSVLDLEPAGRADCVLALPDASRLVRLALDGREARRLAIGPRRWRVELARSDWPQRLEVVYALDGESPASGGERPLPFASLVDWTVVHSLATAVGVGESGRLLEADGLPESPRMAEDSAVGEFVRAVAGGADNLDATVLSAWDRLNALVETAETAADSFASHPAQDAAEWWLAWGDRFEWLERQLRARVVESRGSIDGLEEQLASLRERWRIARGRLRVVDGGEPDIVEPRPYDAGELGLGEERLAVLSRRDGERNASVAWRESGELSATTRWQTSSVRNRWEPWGWSLGVVLLGVSWLGMSAGGRASQFWARWPQVVLVLVGLVWWVGGPLPFGGLVLVALGVLAALRGDWGARNVGSRRSAA